MAATEEVFRRDGYARAVTAPVTDVTADGTVVLARTVFFPTGGGQPGDTGTLTGDSGEAVRVTGTEAGPDGAIHHQLAEPGHAPAVGREVTAAIDWDRRYTLMRVHTGMHILCAVVGAPVTGGQVGAGKGRLDFKVDAESVDKDRLTAAMTEAIEADHPVSLEWWSADELAERPDLVRTMAVQPPMDQGQVRLVRIGDSFDLQACGGTHVARTSEIGAVRVTKIENKGRQNRRITFVLADME